MKLLALVTAALLALTTSATPQAACTLTGTYVVGTDVSTCDSIVINSLTVPAGVTLDLTKVKDGASISFQGTTKFGTKLWAGPLVLLTGNNLKVSGPGTLDGQGSWYWPKGKLVTRPVFFRLRRVVSSYVSGFKIINMPTRTFSVTVCSNTTLDGLTLDAKAGDGLAKNTDGFDVGRSDRITIKNCKVYNQDDCLAMQSGTNTLFTGNYCHGGHGVSIGSLGGAAVDQSSTLDGLRVTGNTIVNNDNGLRIKTINDGSINNGLVQNVNYTDNVLQNVKNAIVVRSDYSKAKGGYTRNRVYSKVQIKGITISGLSGSATNLYDIEVNPSVVSNWKFSGITVSKSAVGTCKNQPANIKCA